MVSIQGLNKADVLAALYNASQPQGLGFSEYSPYAMKSGEAQKLLEMGTTFFRYVKGRLLKIDIGNNDIDPAQYDFDNGKGAVGQVISILRQTGNVNAIQIQELHYRNLRKAASEFLRYLHSTEKTDEMLKIERHVLSCLRTQDILLRERLDEVLRQAQARIATLAIEKVLEPFMQKHYVCFSNHFGATFGEYNPKEHIAIGDWLDSKKWFGYDGGSSNSNFLSAHVVGEKHEWIHHFKVVFGHPLFALNRFVGAEDQALGDNYTLYFFEVEIDGFVSPRDDRAMLYPNWHCTEQAVEKIKLIRVVDSTQPEFSEQVLRALAEIDNPEIKELYGVFRASALAYLDPHKNRELLRSRVTTPGISNYEIRVALQRLAEIGDVNFLAELAKHPRGSSYYNSGADVYRSVEKHSKQLSLM